MRRSFFLLILSAALAAPACAQRYSLDGSDIPPAGMSLGGRAMWFEPEDTNDTTLHGGAQLRFHFSRLFALEGSADYRRVRFPGSRVDIFPVQASLLAYLLPNSPVSPFLLGGAGWYFTRVEGPGDFDDTQHRFGPHAGGGVQARINRWWSIDATYRFVWIEDIRTRNEANLLDRDFNDEGHMITAGLNFHF